MSALQVDVLFAVGYLATAAVGVLVGVGLLRSRPTTTARAFGVALLGGAAWSVAVLVAMRAADPVREAIYAAAVVPLLGVVVAAFVCGILAVARVDWRPSRRTLLLLAVHPATMLVVGLTNSWHHQLLRVIADTWMPRFGPLFWIHSTYAYGALLVAAVVAVRVRRNAPALRSRQLTMVLAVGALPALAIAVQLTVLPPETPDITPLSFVVVGLVDAQLVFRGRALAALPVARSTVLETIGDGIVVVDDGGLVVDANAAALRLLGAEPGAGHGGSSRSDGVVGRPASTALAAIGGGPEASHPVREGRRAVALPSGRAVVDVRCEPIVDALGRVHGTVVVIRDVTEDTRREEALARVNAELREHVRTIERLRAEVAEQALRDAVTGLHNRRHLDNVLDAQLAAGAGGGPVALAILDADRFKLVNDQHGHAAGDRVLESLAHALTAGVAPGDTLVRYGGEEFVVVMPGADLATATARVEDLRARCAAAYAWTRAGTVRVTVSAGLAIAAPGTMSPGALLDAADSALYEAKRSGRDRLEVAGSHGSDREPAPRVASSA